MVLLAVLLIFLLIGGSSVSFIWVMNQQQTRAGIRYRSSMAAALAEAGIHRALSILESVSPDGSLGRAWRPTAHSEVLLVGSHEGRFTVSLSDDVDGAVLVTSVGEVAGTSRKLYARVYLASPALLVALYSSSTVSLENPPAATLILPYGAGIGDRPWIHIAAGVSIWFATTNVSINDPSVAFDAAAGPVDPPLGPDGSTVLPRPGPVRLLLARGAELTHGDAHRPVTTQQLRIMGAYVEGVVFREERLPKLPEVDRLLYRTLAVANTANANLNELAGRYFGDADLARKGDSLYTPRQFHRLQMYFKTGRVPPQLWGLIYVTGGVTFEGNHRLEIADGALVTEGTVHIGQHFTLEIRHSAATRTLPGLVVLDEGELVVTAAARLRVHGLVFANRIFEVSDRAHVDIVGSVLTNDPEDGFANYGGTVVIRYDPAVLGTRGLRASSSDPFVTWVAAWDETPPVQLSPLQPSTAGLSGPATPPPSPVSPQAMASSPPQPEATAHTAVTTLPRRRPIAAPSADVEPEEGPHPVPPQISPGRPTVNRTPPPSPRVTPRSVAPSPPQPAAATPPPARATPRPPLAGPGPEVPPKGRLHRVQVGAFSNRQNADARVVLLRQAGFSAYTVKDRGLLKVRVGAFRNPDLARELADRLRAKGFNVFIVP